MLLTLGMIIAGIALLATGATGVGLLILAAAVIKHFLIG